ncbi:hypothetical protein BJ508DRAFT_109417 [Ascobolus immersus RN42]|uniref:Uncharacterized protein n=1 Tax=Ascobolus immersus RN42 TaxID=1160509 RepID=A0A3N4I849_ASCIM|nr:hypothetical protein BJ508DRAFT_109417 [Ascobolus immersus RN42]
MALPFVCVGVKRECESPFTWKCAALCGSPSSLIHPHWPTDHHLPDRALYHTSSPRSLSRTHSPEKKKNCSTSTLQVIVLCSIISSASRPMGQLSVVVRMFRVQSTHHHPHQRPASPNKTEPPSPAVPNTPAPCILPYPSTQRPEI